MKADLSEFVGFKLSLEERQKLDMLAQRTERSASQVLRLLIAQAVVADEPDIQLRPRSDEFQPEPA